MKRFPLGRVIALPAAAALTLGIAACGSVNERGDNQGGNGSELSGTISGAGASSQEAAQKAWQAFFP